MFIHFKKIEILLPQTKNKKSYNFKLILKAFAV